MITSLNKLGIERDFLCLEKDIHKNPIANTTQWERLEAILLGYIK